MKTRLLISISVAALAATFAMSQQLAIMRVYEIRARDAKDLDQLLKMPGTSVAANETFNTLTIIASEEQHQMFSELIKKYDVPAKIIEFQFHILKASKSGAGLKDGLPEKIKKVVAEIASFTRYQSFELLDTPVIRVNEGKEAHLSGKGFFYYQIDLRKVGVATDSDAKQAIRIDKIGVQFLLPQVIDLKGTTQFRDVGVSTSLNMADGETVVLGASQLREEGKDAGDAVITLVTAKILK